MKVSNLIFALSVLALGILAAMLIRGHRITTSVEDTSRVTQQGSNSTGAKSSQEDFESRYGLFKSPKIFGPHWDSVPPPTITGSNRMAAVEAFVATNGWN